MEWVAGLGGGGGGGGGDFEEEGGGFGYHQGEVGRVRSFTKEGREGEAYQ